MNRTTVGISRIYKWCKQSEKGVINKQIIILAQNPSPTFIIRRQYGLIPTEICRLNELLRFHYLPTLRHWTVDLLDDYKIPCILFWHQENVSPFKQPYGVNQQSKRGQLLSSLQPDERVSEVSQWGGGGCKLFTREKWYVMLVNANNDIWERIKEPKVQKRVNFNNHSTKHTREWST